MAISAGGLTSPAPSSAGAGCKNADAPTRKLSQGEVRRAVRCLINQERGGKRKLDLHKKLNRPALRHSKAMRESRCLLHRCPGERSLARRLRKYRGGAKRWRYSEVIAVNAASAPPREIVRQWATSSAHRKLILGKFEHLGVGVAIGGGLAWYTVDLGSRG